MRKTIKDRTNEFKIKRAVDIFMKTDNIVKNLIYGLSKAIVFCMPGKKFTTNDVADKYMLTGDKKFSRVAGDFFSCGFSKAVLTPEDVESKKYFIAGYDSNNPAENVLDDMFARSVYIDDNTGRGGVIFCSVDAVGISRYDINRIRKIVIESKKIPAIRSINICATHSHSAVDTQGLWGEKV